MKSKWTGDAVGKMHIYGITYEELGKELGIKKPYVCMILNETRTPANAREKVETALNAIIARRKNLRERSPK